MKIIITGTPATGKTEISKELSKLLNYELIDVKKLINKNPQLVEKIENKVKIIKPKLKQVLKKMLKKDCIIETHLIEYIPKADIIIILRTNPLVLKKRLEERKYSKAKIAENLEVELIDYFTQSTKLKKVIEFDTSKGNAKSNAKKLLKKIQNNEWNKGGICWNNKKYFELINK